MSAAGINNDIPKKLGLSKEVEAVSQCNVLTKRDMKLNGETPVIEVNPETYEVRANGEVLWCEPAQTLSLAQRYFLF
jgi:urease subunit alpha